MILDPENQLTRETLQVCVSKNANFSSAAANLQNYIGRVQVIVSAGLLTSGDNDGTLNVRIDDSPDNSTYTSTGTYTTAFANTAATQVCPWTRGPSASGFAAIAWWAEPTLRLGLSPSN